VAFGSINKWNGMEVVAYTEVTNDDETTSYYNAIFTFSNNLFAIFHKVQLFDNN